MDGPVATQASDLAPDQATDDAFLGGALSLLQPRAGYRAGLDAVMLAASVPARADLSPLRVLDVGAGVGTAGLCLARRVATARVVLLEREPELAALARENVARNGLDERVEVVEADISQPAAELAALGLAPESFDHVIANPPYHRTGAGTPSAVALKAGAHAMPEADLEHWARFMARMARAGACATLIHKAEALGDILAVLDGRFGAIKVLPLNPREGEPAHRVIVRGLKGRRAPLTLLAGMVLHGPDNAFAPTVDAILRAGAPLSLDAL